MQGSYANVYGNSATRVLRAIISWYLNSSLVSYIGRSSHWKEAVVAKKWNGVRGCGFPINLPSKHEFAAGNSLSARQLANVQRHSMNGQLSVSFVPQCRKATPVDIGVPCYKLNQACHDLDVQLRNSFPGPATNIVIGTNAFQFARVVGSSFQMSTIKVRHALCEPFDLLQVRNVQKRGSGILSNIPCKSALRFEPIHDLVFEARFDIFRMISIGNLSVCSIHEQFDYLLFASTSLVVVKSKHNVLTSSPRFRHVFELFQVLVIFCIDGFQISKYDGPSKNVLVNNVFCQASTVVISGNT